MASTLTWGLKGLLGPSCRQHVRLVVASAWYSKLPNPEGWEAVSGDVLAIHARNELRSPPPKKNHRPPWKPSWSAKPKPKKSLGELVFGLHPVLLALRSRKRILYELHVDGSKVSDAARLEQSPLLLQILDLAREQGVAVDGCSLDQIQRLCGGSNHQGVCLDASQLPVPVGDSLLDTLNQSELDATSPAQPIWLYMDRIQDPMNFGAVLRSSCYFGVQKVFTPSKDSCRLSPTVSKASSGALELMELYTLRTPDTFLAELKSRGWWIVGTSSFHDPSRSSPPSSNGASGKTNWDLPPPGRPIMLIVGNEGEGMKPEVSALCDTVLCVAPSTEDNPIGSLNVSVATGIVLHHLSTSRRS